MPIVRFGTPVERTNLHKTVYIDDGLLAWQQAAIIAALHEWEVATNHSVVFTIRTHTTQMEEASITDDRHSLIIRNASVYDPEIVILDSEMPQHVKTTGGYVKHGNSIPAILLVDGRLDVGLYRIAVLHELGHSLSLMHDCSINSIMYPLIDYGAGKITQRDIEQFDELYSIP